ncbi:MAG: hypothetical protein QOJ99_4350 [Bryobacterales bacterium]|nr:hypothetical protein [Bryobacterales bacterium]
MAEHGLTLDHSTIARRVLHYGPILLDRIRRAGCAHPGDCGGLMKRLSELPENGHNCTGLLTQQHTRLTPAVAEPGSCGCLTGC